MEDPITALEKKVEHLNAELHKLRRVFVYGFTGLGIVLLVGLCAPALGAMIVIAALAVILIVLFSATLGRGLGWLVSSLRGGNSQKGPQRSPRC